MATILEKYKIQLPAQAMTYEEFLDWADEDTYAEWVDGKVEMMSPASVVHQPIAIRAVGAESVGTESPLAPNSGGTGTERQTAYTSGSPIIGGWGAYNNAAV